MRSVIRAMRIPICVAALALAAPQVGFLKAATSTDPICKRGDEWAAKNANALPTSMAELKEYPTGFRRRIYGAMSPESRHKVWTEHIDGLVKAEGATWTPTQRALISEIQEKVRSGAVLKPAGADAAEALGTRLISEFGRDKALAIATLEGEATRPTTLGAMRVRAMEFARQVTANVAKVSDTLVTPLHAGDLECNCLSNGWCNLVDPSWWCCPDNAVPGGCIPRIGCGWFGTQTCLGLCVPTDTCGA